MLLDPPLWIFVFWGASTIDLARGAVQPIWRERRGDANKGALLIGLGRVVLQFVGVSLAVLLIAGFVVTFVSRAL